MFLVKFYLNEKTQFTNQDYLVKSASKASRDRQTTALPPACHALASAFLLPIRLVMSTTGSASIAPTVAWAGVANNWPATWRTWVESSSAKQDSGAFPRLDVKVID